MQAVESTFHKNKPKTDSTVYRILTFPMCGYHKDPDDPCCVLNEMWIICSTRLPTWMILVGWRFGSNIIWCDECADLFKAPIWSWWCVLAWWSYFSSWELVKVYGKWTLIFEGHFTLSCSWPVTFWTICGCKVCV